MAQVLEFKLPDLGEGLTEAEIAGSLRLTLGETNTTEQVREAVQIINDVTKNEYRRVQG